MSTKALFVGSFDPLTLGHIDIISRAAAHFDELTVSVVVNPNKNTLFSLDERKALIKQALGDNTDIIVDSFNGLLADYVNNNGFTEVIRGLRNINDFDNEQQMALINAKLYNGSVETFFIMSRPEYSYISSSMVKEVASLGGDISAFVPGCVENAIQMKIGGNKNE